MENRRGTGKWRKLAVMLVAVLVGIWLLLLWTRTRFPFIRMCPIEKEILDHGPPGRTGDGPGKHPGRLFGGRKGRGERPGNRRPAFGRRKSGAHPRQNRGPHHQWKRAGNANGPFPPPIPGRRVSLVPGFGQDPSLSGKTSHHPHGQSGLFPPLPEAFFNIELKDPDPRLALALCRVIRTSGMTDQVMVAAFKAGTLNHFRKICPQVATSAGSSEVLTFWILTKLACPGFIRRNFCPPGAGNQKRHPDRHPRPLYGPPMKKTCWSTCGPSMMQRPWTGSSKWGWTGS